MHIQYIDIKSDKKHYILMWKVVEILISSGEFQEVIMRLIDADLLKENCKITGEFNNNFQGVDLITLGEVIDKQPTFGDWTLIKDDLPPDDVEVLFKTKKYGRKYVGKKRTHTHYDGGKDIVYRCVTARGSEVTGLKPVAWMYLPD